jgi:hypothetical protein
MEINVMQKNKVEKVNRVTSIGLTFLISSKRELHDGISANTLNFSKCA